MNSIVLPTYCSHPEVEEKLERCVLSIFENTVEPFELIVIEQGKPIFDSRCHPAFKKHVLHLTAPVPFGFARAVNIGMYIATGDACFIVNNDIEVPKAWDHDLLEVYCSRPDMGLLAPEDRPDHRGLQLDLSWWSCVLISKQVWQAVGELDDKALAYRFHDQEWSIRCKIKGYQVGRYGGVQVKHDEASTYRHMQSTVDESAEREEMIRRYGVAHYWEWIQRYPQRVAR